MGCLNQTCPRPGKCSREYEIADCRTGARLFSEPCSIRFSRRQLRGNTAEPIPPATRSRGLFRVAQVRTAPVLFRARNNHGDASTIPPRRSGWRNRKQGRTRYAAGIHSVVRQRDSITAREFPASGAIGTFDVRTHKFTMRYVSKSRRGRAPLFASTTMISGSDFATAARGRGDQRRFAPLRHQNGVAKTYSVPDVVLTIDRLGDAIYCGTSNGVYRVRAGAVTHMRFEPDMTGKTTMVTSRK